MLLRTLRKAVSALMTSLERRVVAQPFSDSRGDKWLWTWLARAPAHRVSRVRIELPSWPRFSRPMRVLFLSDLHVGSHTGDVQRLTRIMTAAAELQPDLLC